MIPRQEFVAMTALSLVQQGKTPDVAAEQAEGLALNLEKRNIRMWAKEPETAIIRETFLAGEPVTLSGLLEWFSRRYLLASPAPLPPGAYQITISTLDKDRAMP